MTVTGAQKEFTVTDKYMKKMTLDNWGKPCIWLNNQNPLDIPNLPYWQREYLEANCIFVNLDHKIYNDGEVVQPLFWPPSEPQSQQEERESVASTPMIPWADKGKERMVYLQDVDPTFYYTGSS